MNKDTCFIVPASSIIPIGLILLTIVATAIWYLYNVEIKTSPLKASEFVIGDPMININTYEIVLIDLPVIDYVNARMNNPPVVEWYITDWKSLHEAVKSNKSKTILANSVLRWALQTQKLFGKNLDN